MLFKKKVYTSAVGLLPIGKYHTCMQTQSITLHLFKRAVFLGVFLLKDVLNGFYLMESLQLAAYSASWNSEFYFLCPEYKMWL